jgi:N-acetylglucosaminyldiphosphoundecaprenol N-acetyl-beta-D-mannosaminyltransferase
VPSVKVLGVRVQDLSTEDLCAEICSRIRTGRKAVISNANVNAMNLACRMKWFRDFLNRCDTVFCDGYGVIVGAYLLGRRLRHRNTYADLMWHLAETAQEHDFSLFFLGASPGVAEMAAERLRGFYPRLRIAGVFHGFFDKAAGARENERVIALINERRPDILIVGFGMPVQEKWLAENLCRLEIKVAMPGGAVFDYMSGRIRRAPRWMTDHGLEWLGRLLIEPRRLWRRYLLGNPQFLLRVLRERMGVFHCEDPSSPSRDEI